MDRCLHSNLFFREEKTLLSDDKLLKNDINVAEEGDTLVILAANGLGNFQGSKYPRNNTFIFT